ncbi:uncharacterized protein LOC119683276 [Teleopsis dalmanni]|uniref:uncharacterized protein LOC119683276 n=1 Tax=Teleopsis dalmanni TaxID=139649 RepID=UPI000D329B25|nr:uncharacterized protein LOC119683276 [Teleopsis dalmanni]
MGRIEQWFLCGVVIFLYFMLSEKKVIEKKVATDIKINEYLIPADVLRDFPGRCFAVSHCKLFKIEESWDLKTTCGRSTCIRDTINLDKLLEKVEICPPYPPSTAECTIYVPETDITASYPNCCPTFLCNINDNWNYQNEGEKKEEEQKDMKKNEKERKEKQKIEL